MADRPHRKDAPASRSGSVGNAVAYADAAPDRVRLNNASATHEAPSASAHSSPRTNKRKNSRANPPEPPSRTVSAPQTASSSMSESDSEKRKNKLGYTRISIACVYCRRRKIRCVMEENDPLQRCNNCIRLKKECIFHPVEQPTTIESRSQSSSKIGQSSTVASSPTDMESSYDDGQPYGAFASIPSTLSSSYHGMLQCYSNILPASGPTIHSPHDIPQYSQGEPPWQYQEPFQQVLHADPVHQFSPHSTFNDPESSGDFAPYPGYPMITNLHQYNMHLPGYSQENPNLAMPTPASSMPYQLVGVTPGATGHYAATYPQVRATFPAQIPGATEAVFTDPRYYYRPSEDNMQAIESRQYYTSYSSFEAEPEEYDEALSDAPQGFGRGPQ